MPAQIRTKPGEPFRESAQTVDLSAAPVIVSVGRGIGEQDNIGDGAGAGGCAGRGAGGFAADLRRGLAADGAAGGQLRPDGRAEAVSGGGDLAARFSTWWG